MRPAGFGAESLQEPLDLIGVEPMQDAPQNRIQRSEPFHSTTIDAKEDAIADSRAICQVSAVAVENEQLVGGHKSDCGLRASRHRWHVPSMDEQFAR